jgi:hypothetical protein
MIAGLMPTDPRDYKVEIGSAPMDRAESASRPQGRKYLSVLFACCSVYQRVYANADGNRYEGRCPRCAKLVRFRVGTGGTDARQFVVE